MKSIQDMLIDLPIPFKLTLKILGVKWSIENFFQWGMWKVLGNILVAVRLKKLALVSYRRAYHDSVATGAALTKLFTHFSRQPLEK